MFHQITADVINYFDDASRNESTMSHQVDLLERALDFAYKLDGWNDEHQRFKKTFGSSKYYKLCDQIAAFNDDQKSLFFQFIIANLSLHFKRAKSQKLKTVIAIILHVSNEVFAEKINLFTLVSKPQKFIAELSSRNITLPKAILIHNIDYFLHKDVPVQQQAQYSAEIISTLKDEAEQSKAIPQVILQTNLVHLPGVRDIVISVIQHTLSLNSDAITELYQKIRNSKVGARYIRSGVYNDETRPVMLKYISRLATPDQATELLEWLRAIFSDIHKLHNNHWHFWNAFIEVNIALYDVLDPNYRSKLPLHLREQLSLVPWLELKESFDLNKVTSFKHFDQSLFADVARGIFGFAEKVQLIKLYQSFYEVRLQSINNAKIDKKTKEHDVKSLGVYVYSLLSNYVNIINYDLKMQAPHTKIYKGNAADLEDLFLLVDLFFNVSEQTKAFSKEDLISILFIVTLNNGELLGGYLLDFIAKHYDQEVNMRFLSRLASIINEDFSTEYKQKLSAKGYRFTGIVLEDWVSHCNSYYKSNEKLSNREILVETVKSLRDNFLLKQLQDILLSNASSLDKNIAPILHSFLLLIKNSEGAKAQCKNAKYKSFATSYKKLDSAAKSDFLTSISERLYARTGNPDLSDSESVVILTVLYAIQIEKNAEMKQPSVRKNDDQECGDEFELAAFTMKDSEQNKEDLTNRLKEIISRYVQIYRAANTVEKQRSIEQYFDIGSELPGVKEAVKNLGRELKKNTMVAVAGNRHSSFNQTPVITQDVSNVSSLLPWT